MSEENVETVRRIYAEWERGNFFGDPDLFDPDIHVVWVDAILVPEGETHGLRQLSETMMPFLEAWDDARATAQKILDAGGDDVLALVVWQGRGRRSGVPVEQHQTSVWTVVEGRITRLVNYGDPAKGLKAAGFSE